MSVLVATGLAFALAVAFIISVFIFMDWRTQKRLREEYKRDLAGRR